MDTIGLDDFGIAYTAIPRCANTSIKLSLFELATGGVFERYIGGGPLWPHSTSKLEIHRNDVSEFRHFTELDKSILEADYDFWFTVVGDPIRRLFSSYYMFVLLEDPHLTVMERHSQTFPILKEINYPSIRTHFESFVNSEYLESLMKFDVHFIPQSTLLREVVSSSKLRFYGLDDIGTVEKEINELLSKKKIEDKLKIPRINSSLVSVDELDISLKCRSKVESLYRDDLEMIAMKTITTSPTTNLNDGAKNEKWMKIAVEEIRERNRRIIAIYQQAKSEKI